MQASTTGRVAETFFRAMGSDIHLIIVGGETDLTALAIDRIEQLEARWSRFRDTSEVSLLNASAGDAMAVSTDTVLLVQRAIDAWRITGGGFDPTLLEPLRRAGYDASFDELTDRDRSEVGCRAARRFDLTTPGCTDIVVAGDQVTIPIGAGFDPGGIGKGLAADLVAGELIAAGADGVCVNMGGDIRVMGSSPTGGGWTLAIEHPQSPQPIALVGLADGAVATSSVLRRAWMVNGERRHHLIDPSTGEPSRTDLALASVIAGEAWMAEVLAKAVLLRGSQRAFDLLDESCAAVAVDHDGAVMASAGFGAFLGAATLPPHLDLITDSHTGGHADD